MEYVLIEIPNRIIFKYKNKKMFCTDIPDPFFLVFSSFVPHLLYYSHIPTALAALFLGLFIYFKNRQLIASQALLFIAVAFFGWTFFDLILWTNNDSRYIMFYWSIINFFEIAVTFATFYFAYVFIEKRDLKKAYKFFFGFLIAIFALFLPTRFNLPSFSVDICEAQQGPLIYYFYALEVFFQLFLASYLIRQIIIHKQEEKKKIIYFSIGIILFTLSFSGANLFSSLTGNWQILQYGLFGMPIFMAFLAYLIVKYEAFDIKLLGAQALLVTQIILIASQFAFIRNNTNKLLTGITLGLTFVFGYYLIKSIKQSEHRKAELELMSTKLAQSNDKLRKLDNAKSEFISIASHQLRTPLTAIKGFISLLLEGSYGKLQSNQEDVLNKIYTSNERLVNLVEDLLNVSRMESGRMEFKFANCQLDAICQDVVDTFVLRARDHGLSLAYIKPKNTLPEIMADGAKIREVISNLTDNALKYTPDNHGGVKIKLEQIGENLRITISDTGIGIPPEELPYLFAKFSRGKDISRLNTGGTGLGLYVSRGIVENNGGKIWAESDGVNLGSRFIVEFPLHQSEELIKLWG